MSLTNKQPTILVIVGITGDLAQRKLLPAIEKLAEARMLPDLFMVVGVTRREVSIPDVIAPEKYPYLSHHLQMCRMDLEDIGSYKALRGHLAGIDRDFGQESQKLFYLSVPPEASQIIIQLLGEANFGKGPTKLLLEKPFGTDLASAQELVEHIRQYFDESQVYRIDHFLAKDMAQNLLVFRGGNSLVKHTWSKEFIERIEIEATEEIDIEGRATFFEQTGALRDVVQSHLMQLAALTLMELTSGNGWDEVPDKRLAALNAITLADPAKAVRAQYKGYAREVNNPHSQVETFVSVTLYSSDERWHDVPIILTTGKAMDKKCTEVRICYRREDSGEANQLTLRIQPFEGIELELWSKQPGYERELERVQLQFDYDKAGNGQKDAYEKVFLDAIRSDHSLFTSSDEILSSWRILEPIQQSWSMQSGDLQQYEKGSSTEEILNQK